MLDSSLFPWEQFLPSLVLAISVALVSFHRGILTKIPLREKNDTVSLYAAFIPFLLFILFQFFAPYLLESILEFFHLDLDETPILFQCLIMIMSGGAIITYTFLQNKKIQKSIWGSERSFRSFFIGMGNWLILLPWMICISIVLTYWHELSFSGESLEQEILQMIRNQQNFWELFFLFFLVVCIGPIYEEILFRGFLQSSLKKYFKIPNAIIITSLVFASMHIFDGEQLNLSVFFPIFCFSLFIGYLRERYDSLVCCMGLHSMFNLMTVFRTFLD